MAPTRLLLLNILLLLISLASNPAFAALNPSVGVGSPSEQATSAPAATASPSPTPAEPNTPNTPTPSEQSTPSPSPTPSAAPQTSANSSPSPASPSPNSAASPSSRSSSASQASAAASASASSLASQSSTIVIVTVTRTGADGQVYTSVASSYTPLPRPSSAQNNSNGGSSGSSSSTWAIIGGVVGGLVGIAAVVFIVFRCTQKRFSDLNDEDVAIKWPELVNRSEDPSTLNPRAARPGVGHGIGEDDETDEKPGLYPHDIAMEPLHSDQRHPGMYDSYQAYHPPMHSQEHPGYLDDPYLGPSAAQQPYPPSVNNLGYDEMGYQSRSHDLQAHPSHSSSVTMGPDMSPSASQRAPSRQMNQTTKNNQFQDSVYWDGPEEIPLSGVNSAGTNAQNHPHHH